MPKILSTEKVQLILSRLMDRSRCWSLRALMDLVQELGNYCVHDPASEEYLRDIVRLMDTTVDINGAPVLHFVEPGELYKKLLQLGMDPDVSSNVRCGGPESYYEYDLLRSCSRTFVNRKPANVSKANILSKCRPNLRAQDHRTEEGLLTLAEAAKTRGLQEIAEFWMKVSKDGFPSLAQLAHDQDWYAVRNLCRRRIIPDREKNETYNGKTAIEWVHHHGTGNSHGLKEELQYLLKITNEEVTLLVDEAARDELKEIVLMNSTKTQEELEAVKKEIAEMKLSLKRELLADLNRNADEHFAELNRNANQQFAELNMNASKLLAELKKQLDQSINKEKQELKMELEEQTKQLELLKIELKTVGDRTPSNLLSFIIAVAVIAATCALLAEIFEVNFQI